MGFSEFQLGSLGRGRKETAPFGAILMEIVLSQAAAEHIRGKGGRIAVDLLQHSS